MIRVGITGAESWIAGELFRLLLHHPEVDIVAAHAPRLKGHAVNRHHRGLVGDTDLRFSDHLDLNDLDVVFVTSSEHSFDPGAEIPSDLKVIWLHENGHSEVTAPFEDLEFVPGVSEMFRKPLVRGARASKILSAPASVALIALFPLALHLLLNDTLKIKAEVPEFIEGKLSAETLKNDLDRYLHEVQLSFNSIEQLEISRSETMRALILDITFNCSVSKEELEKIYESIYDDHNFTFLTASVPSPKEVAGTHKCLLHIDKPSEGEVRIRAVADSILRGGAGDAVHAMNLLFGLFEKTGLSLSAGLAFD